MLPSSPSTTATHTAIDTLNPSLAAHVQVTLRVGHCAAAADLCHVTKVRVMGKGAKQQSLHIADMSLEQWLALWRAVGDAVAIAISCAQHARAGGHGWARGDRGRWRASNVRTLDDYACVLTYYTPAASSEELAACRGRARMF